MQTEKLMISKGCNSNIIQLLEIPTDKSVAYVHLEREFLNLDTAGIWGQKILWKTALGSVRCSASAVTSLYHPVMTTENVLSAEATCFPPLTQ